MTLSGGVTRKNKPNIQENNSVLGSLAYVIASFLLSPMPGISSHIQRCRLKHEGRLLAEGLLRELWPRDVLTDVFLKYK